MIIYRSSCHGEEVDLDRELQFRCKKCGEICELIEIEVTIEGDHFLDFERKRE